MTLGAYRKGFTIVEMMVVIVILGILVTLSGFGYQNWQQGLTQRQAQSDLVVASTAMESAKSFANGYPTSLPASYKASDGVALTYVGGNATTYCLEARGVKLTSIVYYIDSAGGKDPKSGACGSMYTLAVPSPTVSGITSTSMIVSWPAVTNATSYVVKYGASTPTTTASCTSSPCTLAGLANSTNYKVTVTANSAYNTKTSAIVNGTTTGPYIATYKAFESNYTACAIAADDNAYCWGFNGQGQVGDGTTGGSSATIRTVSRTGVLAGKTVTQVTARGLSPCVVASDGYAYCWGQRTGSGTGAASSVPVAVNRSGVLAGKTIKQISNGIGSTTCVIASDDRPYCWGHNAYGQNGDGTIPNAEQPAPVAVVMTGVLSGKTVKQISVGNAHSCVVASDNLPYCWGSAAGGALGNGVTAGNYASPVAVNMSGALAGKTIKQISAGSYYTCVVASDDKPYCWGSGQGGRLGNATSDVDTPNPAAVSTASGSLVGKSTRSISAGTNTCAVATDNTMHCWGANYAGQLGNNSLVYANVPQSVYTGGALSGKTGNIISAGNGHTCALASDGKIYCWGDNQYYVFGTTSPIESSVAIKVPDMTIYP